MKKNIPFLFHIYRDKDKRVVKRAKLKYLEKTYKLFDNGESTFVKINRVTIKSVKKDIYFVIDNFSKIIY